MINNIQKLIILFTEMYIQTIKKKKDYSILIQNDYGGGDWESIGCGRWEPVVKVAGKSDDGIGTLMLDNQRACTIWLIWSP